MSKNVEIQYFADDRSGCSVLVFVGHHQGQVRHLQEHLEKKIPVLSFRDLLRAVDKSKSVKELQESLLRLGIGTPPACERKAFKRINKALGDPDPKVRWAELWATAYSRWPEFRPALAAVA
ncbi:hypothetical protein [Actinoallomurus acaciae]|uniref:Uncharacterized protein n=1 Tax=Actinoallomurus acaciae TaxID=502577 RepID=A0ABV5YI72_9ACTN